MFSFVHVIQRCPVFQAALGKELTANKDAMCLMEHENGITVSEDVAKTFGSKITHDPTDLSAAMHLANDTGQVHMGLYYQDKEAPCYDDHGASNLGYTAEQKQEELNFELDKYAI